MTQESNKMSFYEYEFEQVLSLIRRQGSKILDVGCGQGRYLVPLSESHEVVGVDISKSQVDAMRRKNFNVIEPMDVERLNSDFDYIIISHVIEHIYPSELIQFLDFYIDRLKHDGSLIIATPLLYDEFYDDYDHIKPYTPKSLEVLFSDYNQQAYKPVNRLTLKSLWIRKWPYVLREWPNDNKWHRMFKKAMNRIFLYAYRVSGCSIGRETGWVGEFRKNNN